MRNIKSYIQFQEENVQEGIKDYLLGGLATIGSMGAPTQPAFGQSKTPTEIVAPTPVKKDLLGRTLTQAPDTKTETLKPNVYLQTAKLVNPSAKKDAEMKAKGYTVIWTDTVKSTPKWGIEKGERKAPVVMKSDNDKFFELGGYTLTQEVKDRISSQVQQLGGVDSVTIEASTDKTRLTPKLKADLESQGYSGDNKGLSKARSNAIKRFLVELGVDGANVKEVNLADQGKEGGYDPSARYVKLILVEKGSGSGSGNEYFEDGEEVHVYYQKIVDRTQKRPPRRQSTTMDCEDGKCPVYD